MITRPAPKPVSSKKREGLLIHVDGDYDQIKQLFNILNASPLKLELRSERARLDATLDEAKQTFHVVLMPAVRYEPAIITPRPEYPGYVYLFRSRITLGRYKIGVAVDVQRRVGQVNRDFEEEFERIHSIYSEDAYGLEQALHKKYAAVKEEGEKEIFWLSDIQVDEIRAK